MISISFPTDIETIKSLKINDQILISGKIFCGRDAVLPKIVKMIENDKIAELPCCLGGGLIFHTAVSCAGVGPTSSNKKEIEESMGALSKAGIRMHLGKGALSAETVRILQENNSVYAVIPPVTALLNNNIITKRLAAFPELGMEALYELEIKDYPAVIAVAQGESIYGNNSVVKE